ncbi:uncharacterized protein LOC134791896 isoform X2 [Cydia splendana]|uniref:uncharacterized protein LOC134651151 isoform X2 n=1 Tax=Cydia amplana TaxID=1869771 RepID=UPI00212C0BB9
MLIPTCLIKLTELLLTIACLVLHHYSYDLTDVPTLILCSGTYVGFIVVLSGEIVGEAVSATSDAFVDAWWSCAGAVLFGACGALTLLGWRDVPDCPRRTQARAAAMCAIAATVLLIVDALLALCAVDKDDLSSKTRAK